MFRSCYDHSCLSLYNADYGFGWSVGRLSSSLMAWVASLDWWVVWWPFFNKETVFLHAAAGDSSTFCMVESLQASCLAVVVPPHIFVIGWGLSLCPWFCPGVDYQSYTGQALVWPGNLLETPRIMEA